MEPSTHLLADRAWVGAPVAIEPGRALAALTTLPAMAVDAHGLVHGGFVFGLADYAAMLAVNHPHVVLGAADVRFVAPVRAGEEAVASAHVRAESGRRREVEVVVRVGEREVLRGVFTAFVLDRNVLIQNTE